MAQSLSFKVGCPLINWSEHTFPDGESLVKLESAVAGVDVTIVCDLSHPNSKILPLFFLSDLLRKNGAKKLTLIAPYLPYMRQDKIFHTGELVTAESFAKLLSPYFDALYTVDAHLHRINNLNNIYKIPSTNFSAASLIGEWIKENIKNPLLIGPDEESLQWVKDASQTANAPYVVCSKIRKNDFDVEVSISGLEQYKNLNPVLVDDIISTAHTLIKAAQLLKKEGFVQIAAVATHALFAGNAFDECGKEGITPLITTNSISHTTNGIDLSPLFAKT